MQVTKLLKTANLIPESMASDGIVGSQPSSSKLPPPLPPPPEDRPNLVRFLPLPPPPGDSGSVGGKQHDDGGNR